MIDWKEFPKNIPTENSRYLVFCHAGNFDSEWIDVATWDGEWKFFHALCSHPNRVKAFAKINYPLSNAEIERR